VDAKTGIVNVSIPFDVTTSYSSLDRAAWLEKVTSQRAVPYRKQDGGVNRGHGNRIKNNMAARI
jgi:hypothetical protein